MNMIKDYLTTLIDLRENLVFRLKKKGINANFNDKLNDLIRMVDLIPTGVHSLNDIEVNVVDFILDADNITIHDGVIDQSKRIIIS